ncbi:hypothetical protein GC096_08685 [Paenibacillus sp. LMG 31461]|uniref:DUF695 domain-containing protein n=1 Tax=Paenibacillus plantarum TaxID=2654975 RepID=A0ABX1X6N7_9BACL|nr:hypothetical protein [Paenibacillus plantarum]NOU64098.1 hypothetical protein [Paenibacillus plantarum]
MKFTYKLNSIGWANVELEIDDVRVYIRPSYLSEPLVDLVRAVESLIPECVEPDEVKNMVIFSWDSEPAIHRWNLEIKENGKLRIKIDVFKDGIETLPFETRIDKECIFNDFIHEIVLTLEAILSEHGIVGYRKQWYGNEFPISSFMQLKHYLSSKSKFPIMINNPDEWDERFQSDLSYELEILKIKKLQ